MKTKNVLCLMFSILLLVCCYWYVFDIKIDLNGDNISYLHLGKSLACGKGYVDYWNKEALPANHLPPGYPFIISLMLRVFGENLLMIQILNGVFFVGSLLLFFKLFTMCFVAKKIVFVSILFCIVNTYLIHFSTIIMSEMPFLFFSMLSTYLFLRLDQKKSFLRNPFFYVCLASIALCCYIRTAGLSLIAGIIAYLLMTRQWKAFAAYSIGLIGLLAPWFVRGVYLGGNSYINQLFMVNVYRPELGQTGFSDLFRRFCSNLSRYITQEIPNGMFPFIPANYDKYTWDHWLIGLLIISLVLYGLVSMFRYRTFFMAYLTGTFLILLLWPDMWFGVRFLLPTIPILVFLFLFGVVRLIMKHNKTVYFSPFLLIPVMLFYWPQLSGLHKKAISPYPSQYQSYFDLAKWTRENTDTSSVIACRKPELFAFFSHRYTTTYAFTLDQTQLIRDLEKKHASYVVLDQLGFSSTSRYLYPAIINNPDYFKIVACTKTDNTCLISFDKPLIKPKF